MRAVVGGKAHFSGLQAQNIFWKENGGRGWIRTSVGARQRIYSPSPLATRAPFHVAASMQRNRAGCQRMEARIVRVYESKSSASW